MSEKWRIPNACVVGDDETNFAWDIYLLVLSLETFSAISVTASEIFSLYSQNAIVVEVVENCVILIYLALSGTFTIT